MTLYAIMRMPGPRAKAQRDRRAQEFSTMLPSPRPKRAAVIEEEARWKALEAFARAEQIRSSHVKSWYVAGKKEPVLHVTIRNGRHEHEVRYEAWSTR